MTAQSHNSLDLFPTKYLLIDFNSFFKIQTENFRDIVFDSVHERCKLYSVYYVDDVQQTIQKSKLDFAFILCAPSVD